MLWWGRPSASRAPKLEYQDIPRRQTDSLMAEQIASPAVGPLKMKRIAVINDSNDYGVSNRDIFIAALKKMGMEPAKFSLISRRTRTSQPVGAHHRR